VNNSGEGSSIIFNYMYKSVVDGTCELEGAKKHREMQGKMGELFTFGVDEGTIDDFLSRRGFHQINNATPDFLKNTYFRGANQHRKVLPYLPIVHATVKPRG
jgi:O-methyltransferase involved in polyketide biosynthesis